MTDEMDPLMYGGGHVQPVVNESGVEGFFFAPDIVLANEIEMDVLAPGQLADNQQVPACVTTFKGIDANSNAIKAVTVVMDPDALLALIKLARYKYAQIPIEFK